MNNITKHEINKIRANVKSDLKYNSTCNKQKTCLHKYSSFNLKPPISVITIIKLRNKETLNSQYFLLDYFACTFHLFTTKLTRY